MYSGSGWHCASTERTQLHPATGTGPYPVKHFDIQRRLRLPSQAASGRIAVQAVTVLGFPFQKARVNQSTPSAAGTNGSPTNEGDTHNHAGTDRALVKLPRPPCPVQWDLRIWIAPPKDIYFRKKKDIGTGRTTNQADQASIVREGGKVNARLRPSAE